MTSPEFSLAYNNYLDNSLKDAGSAIAGGRYGGSHSRYYEDGCTESRVGFGFDDYYEFRPGQEIPRNHNHAMFECHRIYREHGVVRNILDVMVDFTTSNIRISHERSNIQRLGRKWFRRVKGIDVSTQFNLGLYLYGVNFIDTYRSKMTIRQKRQLKDSTTAALKTRFDIVKKQGTIPYKYVFMNPIMMQIIGGPLIQFLGGDPKYAIRIPTRISQILDNKAESRNKIDQEMLDSVPKEVLTSMKEADGFRYYPLDRDLTVYHYRKNDWQKWADPILISIYRDLRMLEQAQLADMAALDGAINQLMIIKLGDLEQQIVPTSEAFLKLKEALLVNTGGSQRVITWGPDIDLIQSNVDIAQYLDAGKYGPIMERIYGGLGIPPSMTGSNAGGGSTNNLVSLRGFVERLIYGRQMLKDFWETQLADFSREMGIKSPFHVEFDIPNLGDVEVEKKLVMDLWDRGIVSNQFARNKFGAVDRLESKRTIQEKRSRDIGRSVPKAGPFNDPETKDKAVNRLVQSGRLKVDELGVRSKETKQPLTEEDALVGPAGNETVSSSKTSSDTFRKNRKSVNGRPPGSLDSEPRTRNDNKPILRASKLWAKAIQKEISDFINPIILDQFDRKNMRSLTSEESSIAEEIIIGTLFNMKDNKEIKEAFAKSHNQILINKYIQYISETEICLARKMTMDEKRDLAAEIYASL